MEPATDLADSHWCWLDFDDYNAWLALHGTPSFCMQYCLFYTGDNRV